MSSAVFQVKSTLKSTLKSALESTIKSTSKFRSKAFDSLEVKVNFLTNRLPSQLPSQLPSRLQSQSQKFNFRSPLNPPISFEFLGKPKPTSKSTPKSTLAPTFFSPSPPPPPHTLQPPPTRHQTIPTLRHPSSEPIPPSSPQLAESTAQVDLASRLGPQPGHQRAGTQRCRYQTTINQRMDEHVQSNHVERKWKEVGGMKSSTWLESTWQVGHPLPSPSGRQKRGEGEGGGVIQDAPVEPMETQRLVTGCFDVFQQPE